MAYESTCALLWLILGTSEVILSLSFFFSYLRSIDVSSVRGLVAFVASCRIFHVGLTEAYIYNHVSAHCTEVVLPLVLKQLYSK